ATDDTLDGAQRVNEKREENHLPVLPILTISLIKNNEGETYSSSAVREEESKEYRLPSFLRAELQKPFGPVIRSFPSEVSGERMVTVGDITTKLANKEQKNQWLSVIDFTVERKPFFTNIHELNFDGSEELHTIVNSAATITSEIWNVLKDMESTKRHIVLVTGEEDLLVLPLIIFLPLGMNIFYGQPGQGMVWVVVSEETKQKAKALLAQFS
ncbi:MAG TPA: DUF359 domain-containing protein, partial [Patescibacteria group bacterium]|nr:DUF359 domain-containing protein [Patescibacteria group bacterium]